MCKKYVSPLYWDDLEKPFHRFIMDPTQENAYLSQIFKKGMQMAQSGQITNMNQINEILSNINNENVVNEVVKEGTGQ